MIVFHVHCDNISPLFFAVIFCLSVLSSFLSSARCARLLCHRGFNSILLNIFDRVCCRHTAACINVDHCLVRFSIVVSSDDVQTNRVSDPIIDRPPLVYLPNQPYVVDGWEFFVFWPFDDDNCFNFCSCVVFSCEASNGVALLS